MNDVVVQLLSRVWLCNPMDCSTPDFPVLHCLPELEQIHIDWGGGATYLLILCHPPPFCLQSVFPSIRIFFSESSSNRVAKVLELQHHWQPFQWTFRVDFLQDWLVWSPCSPRESQDSSPAPQFKSITSLAPSLPYGPTLVGVMSPWSRVHGVWSMVQSDVSAF